ncbi:MAG: hypothetical protein HY727_15185 [Candidatus Rokubacteria bacterium]|nr:hypothetical protein [Candidatus Rokubacteria bacterium]
MRTRATFKVGEWVKLPEGGTAEVLGEEQGFVKVRLDGESVGLYPPERLSAARQED